MTQRTYNVLFLCTGNSARSILAEAILNREGRGRFRGFSAGSHPKGEVHPYAIDLLERLNHDTAFARSKSWDEFAAPGAPRMDFVFTVCDQAAAEECPYWPGQPMTAHWGLPDPAAAEGNEAEKAPRLRRHLPDAEEPHLDLRQPAARLHRPAGPARQLDEIGRDGRERRPNDDRPVPPPRGRGAGHRAAGGDRRRLRRHGRRAFGRRRRGASSATRSRLVRSSWC